MRVKSLTALAVLLLVGLAPATAAAGGGRGCATADPQEAVGDRVAMRESCFEPNILRTDPGTTVTFVNNDLMAHRVVGLGLGFGGLEMLEQGVEITATFDKPGIYPYVCDLHPGMLGAVVVGDGVALPASSAGPDPDGLASAADPDRGETAMGLGRTLPAGLVALALTAAILLVARRRNSPAA